MTITKPVKGYEDGFEYGRKCSRTMSTERRADNARMVRESGYADVFSPTCEYWRGFIAAMLTTL